MIEFQLGLTIDYTQNNPSPKKGRIWLSPNKCGKMTKSKSKEKMVKFRSERTTESNSRKDSKV